MNMSASNLNNGTNCPDFSDGLTTWKEAKAGTTVYQPCPAAIFGFDSRRWASKSCNLTGQWQTNEESGLPWSDYLQCSDVGALPIQEFIKNIYVQGYSISAITVSLALVLTIFLNGMRTILQNKRKCIYLNLYIAYLLHSISWVLWYQNIMVDRLNLQEIYLKCRVHYLMTMFGTLTTYMWMFMEGLHLYLIIVLNIEEEKLNLRVVGAVAWILPIVAVFAYALNAYGTELPERCWYDNNTLIIAAPVWFSIASSIIFFCSILWIQKTNEPNNPNRSRAVISGNVCRAIVTMIPMFGGQHVVYTSYGNHWQMCSEVFWAITTSSQGLVIAIIFCFAHKEVRTILKSKCCGENHQANVEDIPMEDVDNDVVFEINEE